METIINYINEAKENTRWVAIEITTYNHRYGYGERKNSTSKRVVSEDTYRQLKNERQTASGLEIVELNVLAGPTRDKDEAMAAIASEQKRRKSPINKGDVDYIVYAMNIGKFTPTGKTKYDWNLWEEGKNGESEIYVDIHGSIFLWGAKGSLKKGDKIVCVDNDTQKKIAPYYKEVGAVLPADSRESFTEAYRKEFPDYCKKPTFAFGKHTDGLPLSRFQQIYSIKGISE